MLWTFKALRPTYLGQGSSFEEGEVHHMRFKSFEEASYYLKNSWGWGAEDWEVVDVQDD